MTTARDLITSALRRIGYLDPGEPVSAEDARDALATLNSMMASWKLHGLSYDHTPMTINTTFPLGAEYEEAVKAMLALRLTDDFAPEAETPKLAADAENGWRLIQAAYYAVPKSRFDLPKPEWTMDILGEEAG